MPIRLRHDKKSFLIFIALVLGCAYSAIGYFYGFTYIFNFLIPNYLAKDNYQALLNLLYGAYIPVGTIAAYQLRKMQSWNKIVPINVFGFIAVSIFFVVWIQARLPPLSTEIFGNMGIALASMFLAFAAFLLPVSYVERYVIFQRNDFRSDMYR